MDEKSVESHPNYIRGAIMLDENIVDLSYLIRLWRATEGIGYLDYPGVEMHKPWWIGLEREVFGN